MEFRETWRAGRVLVQVPTRSLFDRRVRLHSSVSRKQVVSAIKEADILRGDFESGGGASRSAGGHGGRNTLGVVSGGGCVDQFKGGIVVESLSAMAEAAQAILGSYS